MAQPNGTTQTLTATVEAVNERGIKIHGGWLNVSKYASVALPMRGALVALEVQGGRWIQRCDVLDAQDAHRAAQRPVAAPGTRERTIPPRGAQGGGSVRGEPARCEVLRRAKGGRGVAAVGRGRGVEETAHGWDRRGDPHPSRAAQELPTLVAYPAGRDCASRGALRRRYSRGGGCGRPRGLAVCRKPSKFGPLERCGGGCLSPKPRRRAACQQRSGHPACNRAMVGGGIRTHCALPPSRTAGGDHGYRRARSSL
jgi:hypothetical protein